MIADIRIEYFNSQANIGKTELERIVQLDNEFFPTPWSGHSWENLFSTPRILSVLFNKNQIFGFALFNFSPEDRFAHLLKIIIVPHARNNGLGKLLLKDAMSFLGKDYGIQNFFLEVEESNKFAILTYCAMGFKVIHSKKDFYGKNKSALIMTRTI